MAASFIAEMESQLWLVFAVFLRIGPAFALAPGYGESTVPPRVRIMLAVFVSLAAAPVLQPYLPAERLVGDELLYFSLKETSFGFFLGLFSRGIIFLLEQAGAVISQTISLSQMLGNATEPMPVMSHILTVTGLAIIFSTSLGDQILFGFLASYLLEPLSRTELWGFFAEKLKTLLNYIFKYGFIIASGFVSLFFVYYHFIGFVNKAMPQFMVSLIGIPFVALLSMYFMHEHHELLLHIWQDKAAVILMMPFVSAR